MNYNHKRIILISLLAAGWLCSILYLMDYPREAWAGVAAVAYIILYVTAVVVSAINTLALKKTASYVVATFGDREADETISSGQRWVAEFIGTVFLFATGYITAGIALFVTSLVVQAMGLPPLDFGFLKPMLGFPLGSLIFIVGFHAGVHLAILRARLKKGRGIHPVALVQQYLSIGLRKIAWLSPLTPIRLEKSTA